MARIGDDGCRMYQCIMEALEEALEKYGCPAIMGMLNNEDVLVQICPG